MVFYGMYQIFCICYLVQKIEISVMLHLLIHSLQNKYLPSATINGAHIMNRLGLILTFYIET